MAKAFKCDICRKYFDYNDKESNEIVIRHGTPNRFRHISGEPFEYDEELLECCPKCMNKLCDAINFARGYTNG